MSKKKDLVIFVIPSFELGGTERQVLSVASGLKTYCKVIVIGQRGGSLINLYRENGITTLTLFPRLGPSTFKSIRYFLKARGSFNKLIVDAFLPSSVIMGAVVKMIFPKRLFLIGNRRSMLFYRQGRRWLSFLDQWGTSKCDALVCNSPVVANEVLERCEIPSERVLVIPNGIMPQGKPTRLQMSFQPQIFHVSNHHPYKKSMTLLKAIRDSDITPMVRVHLFGEGAETSILRTYASENHLDQVSFYGQEFDPWSKSQFGDIYVHTSETEGFSNSILEAMNYGLVPIVTDLEANHFVAGDSALYFAAGDYQELRVLIGRVISDRELRKTLSNKARSRVLSRFTIDSAVKRRRNLYQTLGV
jgi:glycosyltransferase involved in cell wall biosynthesis